MISLKKIKWSDLPRSARTMVVEWKDGGDTVEIDETKGTALDLAAITAFFTQEKYK